MITILAAQIFIQAFVLCLILYLVARYEADYSFQKIAMVSGGIMAGTILIEALGVHKLGMFVIVPQIAFIAFMLMTFCWITFWKSMLVVLLFSLVHIGFSFGVLAVKNKFFGPDDGVSPADKAEKQFRELEQEMLKTMGIWPEEKSENGERKNLEAAAGGADEASEQVAPADRNAGDGLVAETNQPPANEQSDEWAVAHGKLNIGGIMTGAGGKRVVIINGELYETRDMVSVAHNGLIYRWVIRAISDGGAELQPREARKADR